MEYYRNNSNFIKIKYPLLKKNGKEGQEQHKRQFNENNNALNKQKVLEDNENQQDTIKEINLMYSDGTTSTEKGTQDLIQNQNNIEFQYMIRTSYRFIKCQTIMVKGNEDILYYCISSFNDFNDEYFLVALDKDSMFIKDYPNMIKPDQLILVAYQNQNHTLSQCEEDDTLTTKLFNEMSSLCLRLDQFFQEYINKAWQDNYEGDDNIYDEFISFVFNNENENRP